MFAETSCNESPSDFPHLDQTLDHTLSGRQLKGSGPNGPKAHVRIVRTRVRHCDACNVEPAS